jgi:hypothetical protein
MRLRPFALVLVLAPWPATAAEVAVGPAVGLSLDLPDAVSGDHTAFGAGVRLAAPLRVGLGPAAALRVVPSLDFAGGRDRVTWEQDLNGAPVRFVSDDHGAWLLAAALVLGPELRLPVDGLDPFVGAGAGLAWVTNYHAFSGVAAQQLLDPAENDLGDPGNIDPYSARFAPVTELWLGVRPALSERVALVVETGYSVAFVGEGALKKTPEGSSAQREPYGWNALRFSAGVSFAL